MCRLSGLKMKQRNLSLTLSVPGTLNDLFRLPVAKKGVDPECQKEG